MQGSLTPPDTGQMAAPQPAAWPIPPSGISVPPMQPAVEEGDPIGYVAAPAPWPTSRKFVFLASIVLLLVSCAIFGSLAAMRFFPQAPVLGIAEATATALSAFRPAVNTPIIPGRSMSLRPCA